MTLSIPQQKSELRARFKSWKPALESQARLQLVLKSILSKESGVWGAYCALSCEVSLQDLFIQFSNIQWAFPRVDGERLVYCIPGKNGMQTGPLGVRQPGPEGAQEVPISELSGVLIPGVAFDLEGTRLGRGKGYYDKNFKNLNKQTYGIALHDQVFKRIPQEDFDLKVKHLVTDRGILHFQ